MGLLGGLLLFGGLGFCLVGIIGIIVGLWMWDWQDILSSCGMLVAGLISGGIGTAILE